MWLGQANKQSRVAFLHWFAVTRLFKNLWRHVPWRTAGSGEHMKLLFVHDSRQTKICYEKICVVFRSSKK